MRRRLRPFPAAVISATRNDFALAAFNDVTSQVRCVARLAHQPPR
jgi:hypothetical protein